MRFFIALAIASISVSAAAQSNPDRVPTRMRDCLQGKESGTPAPTSKLPHAIYMYVTTVMFQLADGKYGSQVGWQTRGSFKEACTIAQSEADKELPADAIITGVVASLVPDSALKRALAH